MPELPEVQTTVNGINQYATGLVIMDVWTSYNSSYHTGNDNIKDPKYFSKFKKQILGKKIINAKRRAKNVLINLDDESSILVHMKMTGHIMFGDYTKHEISKSQLPVSKQSQNDKWYKEVWRPNDKNSALGDPFNRHIRFVISFSNGKNLVLSDTRRFAKVTHIPKNEFKSSPHLKDIGPEPLDDSFKIDDFIARLMLRPKGKIKTVLLDPKIVAGIGNIYSDEILWYAGVHPERVVQNINRSEFKLMYKAMRETLLKGIDFGGDSMSDYRNILGERGKFQNEHNAYRKTGKKCTRRGCDGTITRKVVGARSAHFCDKHQK
jgi:formamidopyrimidine-DNA glycosylase